MKTGLDVLLDDPSTLKSQRVGLLTNPTGVTHDLRQNVDALLEAGVNVVALFSPEHGFRGAAAEGEAVTSSQDARTGLPVHSLYGATLAPTLEMLREIDVLLFDLQDVGARFYTYTTTLALAIRACTENGVRLLVLDRPNPIGGVQMEGPMLDPALQSFVGHGSLPVRYGMTIGELAKFYVPSTEVIAMRGWRREMWFDQTGLPWVPPSPNMPHLSTAIVYPGTCLLEGVNVSVGRGTPLPFEIFGAPWMNSDALAVALNERDLEGVRFRPITFTPSANTYAGETCQGVQIHVMNRDVFKPVAMGLRLIASLFQRYPDQLKFNATHFDRLIGDAEVRANLPHMREDCGIDAAFAKRRNAVLLYN